MSKCGWMYQWQTEDTTLKWYCCMSQETQTGALYQSRGVRWGGRWEGGSKGSGYIYITMADSCWGLTENNKIL